MNPAAAPFADAKYGSRVFRHLLRALLREATYLPDPAARSYYRKCILKRFRGSRNTYVDPRREIVRDYNEVYGSAERRRWTTPWRANHHLIRKSLRDPERQLDLLESGRDALKMLAKANLGHETALKTVFMHTYARKGERKWSILRSLLESETPEDTDGLRALLLADADSELRDPRYDVRGVVPFAPGATPKLVPPLKALVQAQSSSGLGDTFTRLKLLSGIEKTNIWGRPIPVRRAANMLRRWSTSLLARVLPPLPPEEHDRLRDIATGKDLHGIGVRPRRPMGTSNHDDTASAEAAGTDPSTEQAFNFEVDVLRPLSDNLLKIDGAHVLTTRYLSRRLRHIYLLVPSLRKDSKGQWHAEFGALERAWRNVWLVQRKKERASSASKKRQPAAAAATAPDWSVTSDQELQQQEPQKQASDGEGEGDDDDSLIGPNWMFSDAPIDGQRSGAAMTASGLETRSDKRIRRRQNKADSLAEQL